MVDSGVSERLYVSHPSDDRISLNGRLCDGDGAGEDVGAQVFCFQPEPVNTVGEASGVADLAERHDVASAVVVTNRFHARRAHMVFDRCTDLEVVVVHVPDLGGIRTVQRIVYEFGALLKDVVLRSCR
ncbi:YdcF family protein [uncultured Corynebacterium sp.]|uniref:YdcF family protein n=1 Tax=uncultured Corynebacterium sp. TaxID=159447 RepID=UPI00345DD5C2